MRFVKKIFMFRDEMGIPGVNKRLDKKSYYSDNTSDVRLAIKRKENKRVDTKLGIGMSWWCT